MNRFAATDLPLPGLKLVERKRLGDARGFLARMFCVEEFSKIGWDKPLAQINHTYTSRRGTVRGLHFQHPPSAEMKLVCCIRGEVWDVAVDVSAGSRTFLSWWGERLSAENGRAMLIPEGFAHGFQALTDDVELLYCHSAVYDSANEAGLNASDPRLSIAWPLPIGEQSERDAQQAFVGPTFTGVAP